jgi:hypothetical protein
MGGLLKLGAHPIYNTIVFNMVQKRGWKKGAVTVKQLKSLAHSLRKKNRPRRKGAAKGYIENIK